MTPLLLTALLQGAVDPNLFNGYLILGYIVMWVIGMVYIITLLTRQRNLERDIELMERVLEEEEKAAGS